MESVDFDGLHDVEAVDMLSRDIFLDEGANNEDPAFNWFEKRMLFC